MSGRDQLFSGGADLVDFAFDERVAGVFPDMIRRSVPGYELVVGLSALLAARHVPAGGLCVDLGCSLGATSLALRHCIAAPGVRILAVDNAPAMLERARANLSAVPLPGSAGATQDDAPRIEFVQADLRQVDVHGAHAVLMTYTLQFVPPEERLPLLRRLCTQMHPDGVLVYAEKVAADDGDTSPAPGPSHWGVTAWDEAAHLDFKRANGYSELEIAGKRTALEHVMRPDTLAAHGERLAAAGFGRWHCWYRCLNWAAFVATPGHVALAPPAGPPASTATGTAE